MSIDQRIKDAIGESVAAHNQSENLTNRIIAWLEALAEGNETLEDKEKVKKHCDLIYQETQVNISEP
jgi:hypothetical protein